MLSLSRLSFASHRPAYREGVFPFFQFAKEYGVWEYIPLDQGGRLSHLLLIGSEKDEDIVKAVQQEGFFDTWGSPIKWDGLEKSEVEKSVWLNRWYFLPSFARMYFRSGTTDYLKWILNFTRRWMTENPAPESLKVYLASGGYNWRDMQVAWRMQNLCWCYFLGREGFSVQERQELYDFIKVHARILLEYFGSQALIENNHQSHGAAAMLHAALLFPDLKEAQELQTKALMILEHHLENAFFNDGNSVELCPGYYPFFVSIFRDSLLLCQANGIKPPARVRERLVQFHEYLRVVKQPDGTMPPINDSTESDAIVSLAILGKVLSKKTEQARSHWFSASNQAVMQNHSRGVPVYAFLDAGERILAHWHSGKLGFHLWFWDRPMIVDSGICNYDEVHRRAWYWTPQAHNTLLVNGKGDYDKSKIKMATKPLAATRIERWESNQVYDWAVMRHDGFNTGEKPVSWVRHFILLKGYGVILVDQLKSDGLNDYEWLFHLTPCTPKLNGAQSEVFTGFKEKNLLIKAAGPSEKSRLKVTQGLINKQAKNIEAPVVHFEENARAITRSFLFLPVAGSEVPSVKFQQKSETGVTALEVRTGEFTAFVTLQEGRSGNAYKLKVDVR